MLLVSGRRRLSHIGIWRSRIELLKAHKNMSQELQNTHGIMIKYTLLNEVCDVTREGRLFESQNLSLFTKNLLLSMYIIYAISKLYME